MAFVIKKRSKRYGVTRPLYYLVESYRDGSKVKRRTLFALGECKTLREFIELTEKRETMALSMIRYDEKRLATVNSWEKNSVLRIIEIRKSHLQRCRTNKEKVMKLMSL